MNYYFLTHRIMTKKAGIITALATATALSVSPASADTNNQTEQQKIEQKEVSKKTEQITCETKLACEALSHSIQAQIDDLNEKLDTASDSEIDQIFAKIDKLNKEKTGIIIASKDAEIKDENEKQARENEKQAKYAELLGELRSIKGSL